MVKDGNFVPGPGGLPVTVAGLEELLHYARLSLSLRQGEFPYDRGLGSRLWQWDRQEEHAADRALAMANEALLWLPGVRAAGVEIKDGSVAFRIATPLGEGDIELGDL